MPTSAETFHAQWIEAWLTSNYSTLEHLATVDFVHAAPNGAALSRSELAAKVRDRTYRIEWGKCHEVDVRPLGQDGAIVRYQWEIVGKAFGTTIDQDQETVLVCVRDGEHWRALMEHRRVLPKGRPRPFPSRSPARTGAATPSSVAARNIRPVATRRTPIEVNLVRDYKPRGLERLRVWFKTRSAPAPRARLSINLGRKRKRQGFGWFENTRLGNWFVVLALIALLVLKVVAEITGW